MTAPVRLLESSHDPAARSLLRAGMRERPRASALRATALAVGVSSSVVAASTTATAAAGMTAFAAPNPAMVAAKWLAVGTLGGLALAGTATVASDWATSGGSATTTAAERRAAAATARANESAKVETTPTLSDDLATTRTESSSDSPSAAAQTLPRRSPRAGVEPTKSAPPAAPASASLPAAQSLSREIALIDGARRSLGSGAASAALQMLDEYAALTRTGTLDREAQLLRIDALTRAGQRAVALALAERYLASYPNDPHAARLRALMSAP